MASTSPGRWRPTKADTPQTAPSADDLIKDSLRDAMVELVELHDSGMAVSWPHGLTLSDARKVVVAAQTKAQGRPEETHGVAAEESIHAETACQDSASTSGQTRKAHTQKVGIDNTDADLTQKAPALKSRPDSVVVIDESLPSAAATTKRGRGRPRKEAACQDSTSQKMVAKRIWGKSALSKVPKRASCQDSHSQIWPEHSQGGLAALSSDPISDADDLLPPPADDDARSQGSQGKRQRSQPPSARCQRAKKAECAGRAQGTSRWGSPIQPGETAKSAVQPASGQEFKTDPASPLFSLDGVAVSADKQLRRDAYLIFKGHFQSEPLDRKEHVNPILPGMRSSEMASLRTGLRMWCDAQGAGWIAKTPDGKKSAWFSVATWKSWRLAYLVAKLQRDLWWQESDNKEETRDHKTSRSPSISASPKAAVTANSVEEDLTVAPEAVTPKRPRSKAPSLFSSPKSDMSGHEKLVTPVKEKKRPIQNSSPSDQPPLKIQPTQDQRAATAVGQRRFRSKTSVADLLKAQAPESWSAGNSQKSAVQVAARASPASPQGRTTRTASPAGNFQKSAVKKADVAVQRDPGPSAAASRSALPKAQKTISIARCSRDAPDSDPPRRQHTFAPKKGPRPKPAPPPGTESDVEDIATGITGMEAYAPQPSVTEAGFAKVSAATSADAQKHDTATHSGDGGAKQDWQGLVCDALDFQAGHAPWLTDLLDGKSEDDVQQLVGRLRQAHKDAMADEILCVFRQCQMDID
eukprot:TRINITY_DN16287_c0_g2_i1.p1 TRINITY_DN16287_c0_g2~~TRINITY_DN16287_c0_g2_i1.p1  ORF type:complete len:751 (+),score=122.45 TRINITY_DN16287_c0_g2_i1:73-2325(+)